MITAAATCAIRITSLTNYSIRSRRIFQYTGNYSTIAAVMNLRYASLAALVATSSAWVSPASVSMERLIRHGARQQQHRPLLNRPFATCTKTETALGSALAAPSSSGATSGRPIAMGSIVNVFRGGLVAVRIDDDLSKVAISLEVNIPEVVDPSESVPEEMKSKKSSSDDLGESSF